MTKSILFAAALIAAAPALAEEEREGTRWQRDVSGNAQTASFAAKHFAESDHGDGTSMAGFVISTSGADMAAFAAAKLDNGERGDN